jgi:hypothetical protein
MYVANYFPEPLTRAGSVTKEPYAVRVGFIRNVYFRFMIVCAAIALFAYLTPTAETSRVAVWVLIGFLFASSLLRTVIKNPFNEARLAAGQLPLLVIIAAVAVRYLYSIHFPVWSILFGIVTLGVYTQVSGRDFSFVGGYVLSMIFSNVAIAFYMIQIDASAIQSTYALLWNTLGGLYVVYDLASLMYRRQKDELFASVTDIFRDVFNVIGWIPKVISHWHRHRILNDLSFELPFRIGQ